MQMAKANANQYFIQEFVYGEGGDFLCDLHIMCVCTRLCLGVVSLPRTRMHEQVIT